MGYILQATLIVAVIGALVSTAILAIENEDWRWAVVAVVIVIGIFAFVISQVKKENAQGPCLKEETNWQYNPATKTNMPYTYCVDRGTWVNP